MPGRGPLSGPHSDDVCNDEGVSGEPSEKRIDIGATAPLPALGNGSAFGTGHYSTRGLSPLDATGPIGDPIDPGAVDRGHPGIPARSAVERGAARRPAPGPRSPASPTERPARRGSVNHLGGALTALIVAGALVATARLGATPFMIAIAAAQGLLVLTWVLGTALPGRLGGLVAGGLAAAGADLVVSRWPHGQLGTLLGVLGLVMPALFVHQLTRGVVRTRVVESLADIAVMVVAVVSLAALVQVRHETGGTLMVSGVVLAAGGALVVGHIVDMVAPMPRFDRDVPRGLLAVIAGVAVGAAAGYLRLRNTVEFTSGRAALLGGAIGGMVSLFAIGAAYVEYALRPGSRIQRISRPVFGALISLGLVAPVGYLLCLAIRG